MRLDTGVYLLTAEALVTMALSMLRNEIEEFA
jgi:hypothetical protein